MITKTMEIPFPIPFSVIRSPIHIRNALPAVRPAIATMTVKASKEVSAPWVPKPITIAVDWIRARSTVTYLVMEAIFFLPSSPSLCSSSNFGIAMVKSCMIMEEVI